jgi:DNA polymerase-1
MIALIDADIVVYQASFGAQTTTDWGDEEDVVTISGSKFETRAGIDNMVDDIKTATGADRVLMVFSDSDKNFRKDVYPLYKHNRKNNRKPVTYYYGRKYVEENYATMFRPGLEADDCLGILATGEVAGFMGDKVVCSIDKDMKSFPCQLYNWNHPEDGVLQIAEVDADFMFFMQVLMGDSTDGYPGCPGIGPVKADRLLADCLILPPAKTGVDSYLDKSHAWEVVVAAYEKKSLTEEDALVQARVARILRASDYDFTTKLPILWSPRGDK